MADQRAPALVAELPRMARVGSTLFGIVGNPAHTYGYHLPPSRLRPDDYSLRGALNKPVGDYACALDAGMDWPASRAHMRWVIAEIAADRIKGVAEVIGSLDGRTARYWSDNAGWHPGGTPYRGTGHITWSHFAIYRSTARVDHKLYAGWGPTGLEEDDMTPAQEQMLERCVNLLEATAYGTRNGVARLEGSVATLVTAAGAEVERDAAEAVRDAELLAAVKAVDPGDEDALRELLERIRVTVTPAEAS